MPDNTKRTAVIGSTGSGKTTFAVWLLSIQNYTVQPWVIVDFKRDKLIAKIPGLVEIPVTAKPPTRPGVYVVRPFPDDQEELEKFLQACWWQEDIGIYIDEGLMVGKMGRSRWMRALLTQGRSKHIPMIILMQRPLWIDRFVLSESDFFAVFRLNDGRDVDTVSGLCRAPLNERLAEYSCHWYDVGSDKATVFLPVPSERDIMKTFATRLRSMKRVRVT